MDLAFAWLPAKRGNACEELVEAEVGEYNSSEEIFEGQKERRGGARGKEDSRPMGRRWSVEERVGDVRCNNVATRLRRGGVARAA